MSGPVAMVADGAVRAHGVEVGSVQIREYPARLIQRAAGDDAVIGETPIDGPEDGGVAVVFVQGGEAGSVADGGRDGHEALVFQGAGAGTEADAVEAGDAVRAAWRQDQPGAGFDLGTDERWELDVVADGDTDGAPGCVEYARRGARLDAPSLGFEASHGALVLEVDGAVRGDQRRVVDGACAVAAGKGAGQEPDGVGAGGFGEQGDQRGVLDAHGIEFARGIASAGQGGSELHGCIFRQHQQLAAAGRALGDQAMDLVREGWEVHRPGNGVGERAEAKRGHGNGAPCRDFIQKPSVLAVGAGSPMSFQDSEQVRSGRRE